VASPARTPVRSPAPGAAGRRRAQHRTRPPLPLLALGMLSAAVATAPLWYLAVRAGAAGWDRIVEILARPGFLESAWRSVALALVVGLVSMAVGTAAAWAASRTRIPGARLWVLLLVLPLAVPSYVAAYAWVSLIPGLAGFWAAVLVMTLSCVPYVVLPVVAALRLGEAGTEEAARSLGAGPWQVFRTVTWPTVRPAVAAGGLLVMLYTLSEFGTVAILRVDVLTRDIFTSFAAAFDRTTAVVQSLILVALALVLVVLERWARGSGARWRVSTGAPRPAPALRLPAWGTAVALAGLGALAALSLLLPAVALLGRLLQGMRGGLDPAGLLAAAGATAWVSLLGAAIALALALPVALLSARHPGPATRLVETASYAGHALPGVVVGLSLVFLTLALLPALYQSVATLALAYAVLFLPKAIGSARSAISTVPPGLEQVARSTGRTPAVAFATVTGRVASPGILAGGLLVMVTAMKELPATLMLRPTGFETLATQMWTRTEVNAFGAAAPYALALVLVAAVPAALLARGVVAPPAPPTPARSPRARSTRPERDPR
jgi:iron(III) transport system permease protein